MSNRSRRWMLAGLVLAAIMAWEAPLKAQEHPGADARMEAAADHADADQAERGAESGHEQIPLLPSNAHEAKEHFLAPTVWTILIFLVLVAILYPTAWKNVLAGLKAREQRIRSDIADAEAARAKAEATLREYNTRLAAAEQKVRDMLTAASQEGERVATNLRMQAQRETEELKGRAMREIESASKQAVAEVYEQAANLSTAIAEKILRRNLNAEDQRELVKQSLEQLQSVGKL